MEKKRLSISKRNSRGATLVEIMVAMVILAVLVIGAAPFIYYGSSGIDTSRNKLAALAAANSRMEQLKASRFTDIANANTTPQPHDYVTAYNIRWNNGAWASRDITDTQQNETVTVNNKDRPITTTIKYVSIDAARPALDYLDVVVTVAYGTKATDTVTLETFISPH